MHVAEAEDAQNKCQEHERRSQQERDRDPEPIEHEAAEVCQPVAMTDQELESWEPQALIPEPVEQS